MGRERERDGSDGAGKRAGSSGAGKCKCKCVTGSVRGRRVADAGLELEMKVSSRSGVKQKAGRRAHGRLQPTKHPCAANGGLGA